MRTVLRAAAVVVVAGLAVPLWAVPASAATASETASVGAYFYRAGVTQQGLPAQSPQAPPNVTGDSADGVAKGNLAVAAASGQEDKVSFLSFSLADLPLDAVLGQALLSVPLVAADTSNLVYGAAPERVRVCKAGPEGFFGEDGQSLSLAPTRLCKEFSSEPGKLSADSKAYVFDVTALAATWLEENDGLALTVAEGSESSAFQIVFAPSDQASLSYAFTAPPVVEDEFPTVVAPDAGPIDSGTSFDSGVVESAPVDSSGGFGSVDAPVIDSGPSPQVEVAAAPAPEAAPQPTVAVTPVALSSPSEVLDPSAAFWLAAAGFGALLALLSLIMGDPKVPAAVVRPSRLSQALAERQSSGARPALGRVRPISL